MNNFSNFIIFFLLSIAFSATILGSLGVQQNPRVRLEQMSTWVLQARLLGNQQEQLADKEDQQVRQEQKDQSNPPAMPVVGSIDPDPIDSVQLVGSVEPVESVGLVPPVEPVGGIQQNPRVRLEQMSAWVLQARVLENQQDPLADQEDQQDRQDQQESNLPVMPVSGSIDPVGSAQLIAPFEALEPVGSVAPVEPVSGVQQNPRVRLKRVLEARILRTQQGKLAYQKDQQDQQELNLPMMLAICSNDPAGSVQLVAPVEPLIAPLEPVESVTPVEPVSGVQQNPRVRLKRVLEARILRTQQGKLAYQKDRQDQRELNLPMMLAICSNDPAGSVQLVAPVEALEPVESVTPVELVSGVQQNPRIQLEQMSTWVLKARILETQQGQLTDQQEQQVGQEQQDQLNLAVMPIMGSIEPVDSVQRIGPVEPVESVGLVAPVELVSRVHQNPRVRLEQMLLKARVLRTHQNQLADQKNQQVRQEQKDQSNPPAMPVVGSIDLVDSVKLVGPVEPVESVGSVVPMRPVSRVQQNPRVRLEQMSTWVLEARLLGTQQEQLADQKGQQIRQEQVGPVEPVKSVGSVVPMRPISRVQQNPRIRLEQMSTWVLEARLLGTQQEQLADQKDQQVRQEQQDQSNLPVMPVIEDSIDPGGSVQQVVGPVEPLEPVGSVVSVRPVSADELVEFVVPSNAQYFLSLRRNQGQSIGNDTSYTTIEALSFPFHYQNWWPFLDLRAHRFDKGDKYAGNLGVGCRFAPQFTDQVFGINAYYDYRNAHHVKFNQLGVGFEMLGKCWNLRINGYLPIGKKKVLVSSCFFDDFIGDFFISRRNYLNSLRGVDFELESHLMRMCCIDFYLAMGAYYYKEDRCRRDIYGTEYRLTSRYCDNLSFSISVTHDSTFKTRIQGEISLTYPFNFCCDQTFFLPVRRREIIVLDRRSRWKSNFGTSSCQSCN